MLRKTFSLLSAAAIGCNGAAAGAISQSLDGDDLIAFYAGQSALPAADEQTGKVMAQLYASGYLNGIVDAGQGTRWCLPDTMLRGETLSELKNQIANMPATRRKQNSAVLIANLLTNNYPCT